MPSVCSRETTVSFGCFLIPGTRARRRIPAACLEQVWIWLAMTEDLGCVKERAGFQGVALKGGQDGLEEPWSMVRRSAE